MSSPVDNKVQKGCRQCGNCCLASPPVLHKQDIVLLKNGVLSPSQLITFRKGEPAWHPKEQRVICLSVELIKIKGIKDEKQCIFYDDRHKNCIIYQQRPVSCAAFRCWDAQEAEEMFLKDTLTRQDIFAHSPSILEMIGAYERHFDLQSFFAAMQDGQDVSRIIAADLQFRDKFCAVLGISEDELFLFLGRSLKMLQEVVVD